MNVENNTFLASVYGSKNILNAYRCSLDSFCILAFILPNIVICRLSINQDQREVWCDTVPFWFGICGAHSHNSIFLVNQDLQVAAAVNSAASLRLCLKSSLWSAILMS